MSATEGGYMSRPRPTLLKGLPALAVRSAALASALTSALTAVHRRRFPIAPSPVMTSTTTAAPALKQRICAGNIWVIGRERIPHGYALVPAVWSRHPPLVWSRFVSELLSAQIRPEQCRRRGVSVAKHRHILRALRPPGGQGVENDDAQDDRGQRPERVCAVAGEAELGEDVQRYDNDGEPACPSLCG